MKRRLQVLSVFAAALMAVRMMAQDAGGMGGGGATDNSGGSADTSGAADTSGGTTTPDTSGASTTTPSSNTPGSNSGNGTTPGETPAPGGTGDQGENGTNPNPGEIPDAGASQGQNPGTTIVPPLPATLFPGEIAPIPGMTPAPFLMPAATGTAAGAEQTQGAAALQAAPVTFTLPGGYGNPSSQSFTLGEGRLARPPITFTATASVGYDSNIFNADANPKATPTPVPGATPPLQYRIIGFRFNTPLAPTPIYQSFRPKYATPTPAPKALGVIGSPVSTATVGVQIQQGSRRTLFTLDLSVGEQIYANQPGNTTDYTGNFDLTMVHRLSPRGTFSLEATAVYQNTPNFALVNAPTNNNNGGNYLNGDVKTDFTYAWGSRFSTVTSAQVNFNLLNTNATNNLYQLTYGTQFRYTVSARDTVTAELRDEQTIYPTNPGANNSALYYLLGLETIFSSRLSNTINGGIEQNSYPDGSSQTLPYVESATTLAIPRGGALSWTNEYGSQASGSADITTNSYRTGLNLSQPLSTKLVANIAVAYNYLVSKSTSGGPGGYNQTQFQSSLSLSYTSSPRLSFSLSYNFIDLLTTQINSSYIRQQIYLGGTYTFQ
jgi:hypothetical protein